MEPASPFDRPSRRASFPCYLCHEPGWHSRKAGASRKRVIFVAICGCERIARCLSRLIHPMSGKQLMLSESQDSNASGDSPAGSWSPCFAKDKNQCKAKLLVRCEERTARRAGAYQRSEEHTSELQSRQYLVCR